MERSFIAPTAALTSLPSTNWKWAKGASAVARIAFLISRFGLALLYLVACTCRKSSLTDLDLPSKGLNRMSTTLTYLNRWVVTSFANFMVVVLVVCLCASLRVVSLIGVFLSDTRPPRFSLLLMNKYATTVLGKWRNCKVQSTNVTAPRSFSALLSRVLCEFVSCCC